MSHFVKEDDFKLVMEQVKAFRLALAKTDPWAVRQGLLLAVEFDTEAALRRGITQDQLDLFDGLAIGQAKQLAKSLPW